MSHPMAIALTVGESRNMVKILGSYTETNKSILTIMNPTMHLFRNLWLVISRESTLKEVKMVCNARRVKGILSFKIN